MDGKKSEEPQWTTARINMAYNPDTERFDDTPAVKTSRNSQRVTYTWDNLDVSATVDEGGCFGRLGKKSVSSQKRLLKNVSGVVQPGQFLAIMGASGAGKTTLLNCLTFRNAGKLKISGDRCINGVAVDTDSLAAISAYVQQDDLFIGTLTVHEHLRFQALLRMDRSLTYDERMERVAEVLQELGLGKCANTVIGDPSKGVKGISGGERKRLAFASEVLTNPPLMFCDEPTSGLDSFMAQSIVQVLKNLASTGKTVVCTIHQPSSEVFALFDRILLLAEGRTAYLGSIDRAAEFFASQGLPCPTNFNPADFYIYKLATVPEREHESRTRIEEICDAYEASEDGSRVRALIHSRTGADHVAAEDLPTKRGLSPYKASWWTQFSAVLWRSWISIVKDPRVVVVKGFSAVFVALLVTLIYQGQESPTDPRQVPGYIQNIQGLIFLFITNTTFENIFGVINVFAGEVPIFLREHFNGMYRTEVYFISKMLAELPLYILFPFISFAIPYYIVGLNPAVDRFFIGCALLILVANVATSFGYFVSCLSSSVEFATVLAAPLILPALLFGGFYLNNGQVPIYLDWLRYLSWFMYGFESISVNQWQGVEFEGLAPCNSTVAVCGGEDVLKQFAFDPDLFGRDIGAMIGLIVGFRSLAFVGLLVQTYRK